MVGTLTPTVNPITGSTVALPGGGVATASTVTREVSVESVTILAYDIIVQRYDSDGLATGEPIVAVADVPEDAVLGTFGASADGGSFAVVLYCAGGGRFGDMEAAVVSADGQSNSGLTPLATPDGGTLPYNEALDIVASSDGGFMVLAIQRYSGRVEALLSTIKLSEGGEQVGGPTELGHYITNRVELFSDDGQAFLVSTIDSYDTGGAVTLWRLGEGGEALAEPVTLVPSLPDAIARPRLADAKMLANGDLLVSWNNYPTSTTDRPVSTSFQRVDAEGNAIGEAIVTERATSVAALQDGGFVVFQDTYYAAPAKPGTEPPVDHGEQFVLVFDRHYQPVGEPLPATGIHGELIQLADGTVVVAAGGESHIFDYPASHDAQWGGTSTYISTWQEQELLTRESGVDFLVSDAGVHMKPWIVNFEAASDGDGINATANDMANHLLGGDGTNVFKAGGGNDKLYMLGGDDWGFGDDGNDLIDAGDGDDVLVGGLGNDSLAGGSGADTVAGDQGDDAVNGHDGDDIVHGAAGRDLVTGDDGADTLYGGNDDDWLNGSAGDDVISGDRGADTLEGGADADQFRFGAGAGHDIIIDFEYGVTGDRIVVDVTGDGSLNGITIPNAAALFDAAEDTEDGVLIGLGEGHSILLAGWEKADLGADMFLLV